MEKQQQHNRKLRRTQSHYPFGFVLPLHPLRRMQTLTWCGGAQPADLMPDAVSTRKMVVFALPPGVSLTGKHHGTVREMHTDFPVLHMNDGKSCVKIRGNVVDANAPVDMGASTKTVVLFCKTVA